MKVSTEPLIAEPSGDDLLESLTPKQREVLDLLIQHKTSKEISRILGISPHTVDQRIMLSRAKLNVASRNEVAQAYRRLRDRQAVGSGRAGSAPSIYEKPVYPSSYVADPDPAMALPLREGGIDRSEGAALIEHLRVGPQAEIAELEEHFHHVLPETFDGPYGTVLRLGAIALFAVILIVLTMGGVAMFAQLSQIFDR